MKPELKVFKNGTKCWYLNGKYHRVDGPAIEYPDGTKRWYLNGKLHREDGPAIEYPDGAKYWYLNDNLHREDGPAMECSDGTKHWFLNGVRHREDGPAMECSDGEKRWYLNGKLHREDGPAIECPDGTKRWYLNGKRLDDKQIQILLKGITMKNESCPHCGSKINTYNMGDIFTITSSGETEEYMLCQVSPNKYKLIGEDGNRWKDNTLNQDPPVFPGPTRGFTIEQIKNYVCDGNSYSVKYFGNSKDLYTNKKG